MINYYTLINLKKVLQRLSETNFKIQLGITPKGKCRFWKTVISESVKPNPEIKKALMDFPIRITTKITRNALKDFARITRPYLSLKIGVLHSAFLKATTKVR